MDRARLRPYLRIWGIGLLTFGLLGLLSASQTAAWRAYIGRPVNLIDLLPTALGDWLTCGLFTPAYYYLVRRFPIRGDRWAGSLPVHLVASLFFVLLKVTIWAPLWQLLNPGFERTWSSFLYSGAFADLLAYWGSVGVIHAIEYYRESRERQLEATRLALENLRAQLQPHFLFNTLQAISTLIYRDPQSADRMLTDLSDLLRTSLRHTGAEEVPLKEELSFLERYLHIMRTRFGDRLVIAVHPGEGTLDALVPSLVLQPIVENAIQHGMADRPDIGHVSIGVKRDGPFLTLEVQDDGPGLPSALTSDPSPLSRGIGLANTRERLARLYGPAGRVDIYRADGKGVAVRLTIPYRLAR